VRQRVVVSGEAAAGASADDAYAVIRDLERNVRRDRVVRDVRVEPISDRTQISHWEINFANGILRWSERDEYDDAARCMRFTLREGDPVLYEGAWEIAQTADGFRILFRCDFDLGIPTLAATLDPLGVRILRETISAQLVDIFGAGFALDRADD
jgi:hypothetical protein